MKKNLKNKIFVLILTPVFHRKMLQKLFLKK